MFGQFNPPLNIGRKDREMRETAEKWERLRETASLAELEPEWQQALKQKFASAEILFTLSIDAEKRHI